MKYLKIILLGCATAFFVAALLLYLAPFAVLQVPLIEVKGSYTGFQITFNTLEGYTFNNAGNVIAFVVLCISLLAAVSNLIVASVPSLRKKYRSRYMGGVRVAISAISCIGIYGILPFLLIMFTIPMAIGDTGILGASLGIGAILSGIFSILGGCFLFAVEAGFAKE